MQIYDRLKEKVEGITEFKELLTDGHLMFGLSVFAVQVRLEGLPKLPEFSKYRFLGERGIFTDIQKEVATSDNVSGSTLGWYQQGFEMIATLPIRRLKCRGCLMMWTVTLLWRSLALSKKCDKLAPSV